MESRGKILGSRRMIERFWGLVERVWDSRKDFGISRKDFERKPVQDPGIFAGLIYEYINIPQ